MVKAIQAHPFACRLLEGGTREASVLWDDPFSGLPCKARPDLLPGKLTVIDVKTTSDASEITPSGTNYTPQARGVSGGDQGRGDRPRRTAADRRSG